MMIDNELRKMKFFYNDGKLSYMLLNNQSINMRRLFLYFITGSMFFSDKVILDLLINKLLTSFSLRVYKNCLMK